MKKAIITVIGKDNVGIIHGVTGVLSNESINIMDISQTIMKELFTMVMLVDLEKATSDFSHITSELEKKGAELGVKITICHEDIFNSMHRI